jgi:hypothetical protein
VSEVQSITEGAEPAARGTIVIQVVPLDSPDNLMTERDENQMTERAEFFINVRPVRKQLSDYDNSDSYGAMD